MYNFPMATLKEVAKAVGCSPSTVSLVLNGKSDQRKISEKTKNRVIEVANQMGYRVNMAARRLRAKQSSNMIISVFVATDQRAYSMTRFILGLQNAAEESKQPYEIVVHFYRSGMLSELTQTIEYSNCAIVCDASEQDINFLEAARFPNPIVLYCRNSEQYCTVNINYPLVGEMVADIFARHGHKHVVLLDTDTNIDGIKQCAEQFAERSREHGMTVTKINETHNMLGGYNGGFAVGIMHKHLDCIFSLNDAMSVGLLRSLTEQNIKVPDQLELISVGTDNPELVAYAAVPISSIYVPVEAMAKECLRLLFMQLDGKIEKAHAIEMKAEYTPRESCKE